MKLKKLGVYTFGEGLPPFKWRITSGYSWANPNYLHDLWIPKIHIQIKRSTEETSTDHGLRIFFKTI